MLARVKYESRNMYNTATRKINSLSPVYFILIAFFLAAFGLVLTYHFESLVPSTVPVTRSNVLAATWNMAAINNNPFEYWITYDKDKSYEKIMSDVSNFIKSPGNLDIPVNSIVTDTMFDELFTHMTELKWENLEKVKDIWNNDYKKRKIISEFLTDSTLGKKRLTSMPDRVTNTLTSTEGKEEISVLRPTVINCYDGVNLNDMSSWWKEWIQFIFKKKLHSNTVTSGSIQVHSKDIYTLFGPIKHAKYPAITLEEEAISIPLQVVNLAIFDAILIHMMNHISVDKWQPLRKEMCENLNTKKNSISQQILSDSYSQYDVVFLQEVSKTFVSIMRSLPSTVKAATKAAISGISSNTLRGGSLSQYYHIYAPLSMHLTENTRDQNSVILLKKHRYIDVVDITNEIMQDIGRGDENSKKVPVDEGDLIVLSAKDLITGNRIMFASFHGDTNGLATIPVLAAVYKHAVTKRPDHRLLFGMDANTYEIPQKDQLGVLPFAEYYVSKNLNSNNGKKPNPKNYTTFHARTFLQSQLNKAITLEDRHTKGDKNPKDFILFFNHDYEVRWSHRDNTGRGVYIDDMIFPTLHFPSDHAITSTLLIEIPTHTPELEKTIPKV